MTHKVRLCQCCSCKAKRARAAKLNAVLQSRLTHVTIFLLVAAGMAALEWYGAKWVHVSDGVTLGAVASKGVQLVGECIADRMFPPEILRD